MGKLYLKDGAYFDLTKGSPAQLETFLQALREYGCTNVPSEPTGAMLASKYIVYNAGGWPRKSRMVLSNGQHLGGIMQYEVVLPDTPKESAPSKMSRRARLRTILAMVEAELADIGSDDDE